MHAEIHVADFLSHNNKKQRPLLQNKLQQ